jgi:PAS domain S-box-containing protein
MPTRPAFPLLPYGVASLAVVAAFLLWYPFGAEVGPVVLVFLCLIAVGAAAVLGGLGPGLLGTVLADLAIAALWVDDSKRFAVPAAGFWIGLALFLAVGGGISCLGEEILRRRRAAALAVQTVADQGGWLRTTLASVNDGVIITDARERVTMLNPTASLLTGWKPAEAADQPLDQVFRTIHDVTRNTLDSPVARALRGGPAAGSAEHTVLMARDHTERRVADTASPVWDSDGHVIGAVLVFREIAPRAPREEPTRKAEADRRKDEVLALLGRELHDPLAAIPRGLELLRQGDPHRLTEARSLIEQQVRSFTRQLDELFTTAHLAGDSLQLHAERVDLVPLLRAAAGECGAVLSEGGRTLSLQTPETAVWVNGDYRRLGLVVHHLLEDAAGVAGSGGHIAARLTVDAGRLQAVLSIRGAASNTSGPNGQRAAGPTTPRDLALAEKLVKLHGGELEVLRGSERGMAVTVRLPLEPEPTALAAPPQDTQPGALRLRVLVVEDNPASADSLCLLMKLLGHDVTVAYSGPEALKAAEECRPHLVLCDIGLPGMDGYHVVQELRKRPATAHTRLIAISGHGSDEDRRRSQEAGFDHHLTKPVDPQVLQSVLALQTLVATNEETAAAAPKPGMKNEERTIKNEQ